MGGLFIDDLIMGIVRMVRRESRRKDALGWSVVDGKITKFTTSGSFLTLPIIEYTYEVNGLSQVGSATGFSIKDDEINPMGDVVDSLPVLRVRYDPAHPETSRILDEDNARLPFRIDHAVK